MANEDERIEGGGDDRANRLGGEGSDTGTAAGGGGGIGDDPGGPGGMGGVRGGMSNPDHRPNGGVSPMQGEPSDRD